MGQGQVSNQSGTSWCPVITAGSYKVAVVIMYLINDVMHQNTNATQKYTKTTQNKFWRGSAISDQYF